MLLPVWALLIVANKCEQNRKGLYLNSKTLHHRAHDIALVSQFHRSRLILLHWRSGQIWHEKISVILLAVEACIGGARDEYSTI